MRTRWLAILAVSAAGASALLGLVAVVALFLRAPVELFAGLLVASGSFIGAGALCVLLEIIGVFGEPVRPSEGRRRGGPGNRSV